MPEIIPAILSNDISDFHKKYAELLALTHHFSQLHVDFADGEFVRNKTVMPKDLVFLKNSPVMLVAHFMTYNPKLYFADAKIIGFNRVLFHYEAFGNETDIREATHAAKKMDLKFGLVVNPETPLHKIGKLLSQFDFIQLMGIHPGAQGRAFLPATFDRIKELRRLRKNVIISVDGGIKVGIARQCIEAGADQLVAGSAILRAEDEETAIEALQEDIKK